MAKVEISYEFIQKAAQHQDVRKRTEELAKKVARKAEGIANSENANMEIWVETGTRPKGRPHSTVYGDWGDQEFGTADTDRLRILGRAAEGV